MSTAAQAGEEFPIECKIEVCRRKAAELDADVLREFVVLLDDVAHEEDAAQIAAKVNAALSAAFYVLGLELTIAASVGIAISPQHGGDTPTLIRRADEALYSAKNAGRNRYALYGESARQAATAT